MGVNPILNARRTIQERDAKSYCIQDMQLDKPRTPWMLGFEF